MIYGLVFLYFVIGVAIAVYCAYRHGDGSYYDRPPSGIAVFIWPFIIVGWFVLSMDKWIDSFGRKLRERNNKNVQKTK